MTDVEYRVSPKIRDHAFAAPKIYEPVYFFGNQCRGEVLKEGMLERPSKALMNATSISGGPQFSVT